MHLPETEISILKRAGYSHDIGKTILDKGMLTKENLSDEEFEKTQQHSAVGYRILSLFDDTLDLSDFMKKYNINADIRNSMDDHFRK